MAVIPGNYDFDFDDHKLFEVERRMAERLVVTLSVRFMGMQAKCKNISETGACVVLNKMLELGEFVNLLIFLPNKNCIDAYGYIVWRRARNKFEVDHGVEFLPLKPRDAQMITALKALVVKEDEDMEYV